MLLSSNGHPVTPAELHGLLVGRSCAGAGFDADAWLADAAQLLENEPGDTVRNALIGLQEMVKGELCSEDVTVVLLLPDDETPLAQRAVALGQWCQGCHMPQQVMTGQLDLPKGSHMFEQGGASLIAAHKAGEPVVEEGTGCVLCHRITRLEDAGGNSAFTVNLKDRESYVFEDAPGGSARPRYGAPGFHWTPGVGPRGPAPLPQVSGLLQVFSTKTAPHNGKPPAGYRVGVATALPCCSARSRKGSACGRRSLVAGSAGWAVRRRS